MNYLKIDNYIITEPIINILYNLRTNYFNGKLNDIRVSTTSITVTCVNDEHKGGKEQNPDAHINIDPNNGVPFGWYYCFACNLSCSFVGFIAHYFSSSNEFAKKWLIDNYGIESEDAILIDDPIDINSNKTINIDESILDKYQKWTPYLEKRKLSRDICEKFNIRYDPYYRQIIIPIKDIYGNIKMLAKRSIDTKFFHMDKEQEKEVYGLNIILKNNVKSCLLVEGPIDLLTCFTHGIPAIATLGTPSDYQIDLINKSCLTSIYIATDNDEAGNKFASILDKKLSNRFIKIRVELPKTVKDVNDLSEDQWNDLIKKYELIHY